MGNCLAQGPKVSKEVMELDCNHDGKISRAEMMNFIDNHGKLWCMLSVNCNIPEKKCRKIARDAAYIMAKMPKNGSFRDLSSSDRRREPTTEEFQTFVDEVVNDPKGQQEFFHRCVFTAFDTDGNGYLEPNELGEFLDIFYNAESIFANDSRLPSKKKLKKTIMKDLDGNGDGKLEFSELRNLISGDVQPVQKLSR